MEQALFQSDSIENSNPSLLNCRNVNVIAIARIIRGKVSSSRWLNSNKFEDFQTSTRNFKEVRLDRIVAKKYHADIP